MIRENIYVRVHGHVRAFAGKRSVVAFRITAIDDMNELTAHMLEVIYAHAYLVRSGTPMVSVARFVFERHISSVCVVCFDAVLFSSCVTFCSDRFPFKLLLVRGFCWRMVIEMVAADVSSSPTVIFGTGYI